MDYSGEVFRSRYKVVQPISEELLGRVYAGHDLETGQPVQIKILHEHIATDEKRFGRFLREVRATSMVRHVNTIELIDSGSENGVHYLVMEDFPARPLEDSLKKFGTMSVERTAHIAAQIASAIGAAHQESITHRALSPRNVLLLKNARRGDFVKVRDFGLSKLERFDTNEEASHLTEAGVRVGNTAYMAPEYIENDRYHPKGDLYALGCLMMTMLTGEPPFTGRAADILGDHVTLPPPRVSERAPVPEWMDELVDELLAKDPTDRPGAYQVVSRLEEGVGKRLGPPALSEPDPTDAPRPAEKSRNVYPALLAAIAAGMLVIGLALGGLTAAVIVLLVSWEQPPPIAAEPEPTAIRVEQPTPTPVPPPAPEEPAPAPAPAPPSPSPQPVRSTEPVPEPAPEPVPPVVEPQPATGTRISVVTNRRALVYLNTRVKGMAPVDLEVRPGIHRVAVALPGQPDTRQEKQVRVKENESYRLTFTF